MTLDWSPRILLGILQNAALLVIAIYAYAQSREWLAARQRWIAIGIECGVFGGLALISMLAPFETGGGLVFDARNTLINLAGLFGGPFVGTVTAVLAGVHRLAMGGMGARPALLAIATTLVLAIGLGAYLRRVRAKAGVGHLATLGFVTGIAGLDAILLMPGEVRASVLSEVGAPYALSTLIGTMILGMIIIHVDEKVSLRRRLRQSMESLRVSETRMREVIENLPYSFTLRDADGRFTHVNKTFERLFHLAPGQLLGKDSVWLAEHIGQPDMITIVNGEDARARETRRPATMEMAYENLGPNIRIGQGSNARIVTRFPIHGPEGELNAIATVGMDVSDLRRAQRQLEAREAALRRHQGAILEISQAQTSASGNMDAVLNEIVAIAGNASNAHRASIWELDEGDPKVRLRAVWNAPDAPPTAVASIDRSELQEGLRELDRNHILVVEDVLNRPDLGGSRTLNTIGLRSFATVPIRIDGRMVGYIALSQFGESRVWSREEQVFLQAVGNLVSFTLLRDRHDQTLAALDYAMEGICIRGPGNRMVFANRSLSDITGIKSSWGLERLFDELAESLDRGENAYSAGRMRWTRPDGGRVDLEARAAVLPNGGSVTTVLDVTERLARAEAEADLTRRLEQASKMEAIGRLSGGIAHDFNNVLGAIIGFTGFLIEDLPSGSQQAIYAQRIAKVCDRAKELVTHILGFSRASDAERAPMELAPVLRDVAAILSGSLPSSTRVTFDLPDEPILVVANPAQITQLLLNLAVNANDALEGEPGRISVRLRHQPPGWRGAEGDQIPAADRRGHEFSFGALDPAIGYASIRVSDNGKGMRPEVMSRIFEPFFTTKERGKGTGLGLSIVHGIVASHQGAYRVESRVNGGTTITIHLPAEAGAAMIGDEAGVVADSRGRERILVIDDEIDLTDVLSIGLERLGYEVGSVNNPNEALAIFAEEPDAWDVVITDQVMPDMKGTSLMPRLKALNPRVKIILTTGFSDGVSVEVAKLSGADGFLAKPSEVSRFAKLVRELLAAPPLE